MDDLLDLSPLDQELEALSAIYLDELEIHPNEGELREVEMVLHPATGDDTTKKFVRMNLVFQIGRKYPDEVPEIIIRNPRGLGEEEVVSLVEDMKEKATESIGEVMLFTLIEMAKETLTEGNIPHCPCVVCLEHFQEHDLFHRTACYHYFHSRCLHKYLDHSRLQIEQEKKEAEEHKHLNPQESPKDSPIVCPVCRMPMDGDSLAVWCSDSEEDEDKDYSVPDEFREQQRKMAELYNKQKAKGAIIDVEWERNKFLLNAEDRLPAPSSAVSSDDKQESECDKVTKEKSSSRDDNPKPPYRNKGPRIERSHGRNRGFSDRHSKHHERRYNEKFHSNNRDQRTWRDRQAHGFDDRKDKKDAATCRVNSIRPLDMRRVENNTRVGKQEEGNNVDSLSSSDRKEFDGSGNSSRRDGKPCTLLSEEKGKDSNIARPSTNALGGSADGGESANGKTDVPVDSRRENWKRGRGRGSSYNELHSNITFREDDQRVRNERRKENREKRNGYERGSDRERIPSGYSSGNKDEKEEEEGDERKSRHRDQREFDQPETQQHLHRTERETRGYRRGGFGQGEAGRGHRGRGRTEKDRGRGGRAGNYRDGYRTEQGAARYPEQSQTSCGRPGDDLSENESKKQGRYWEWQKQQQHHDDDDHRGRRQSHHGGDRGRHTAYGRGCDRRGRGHHRDDRVSRSDQRGQGSVSRNTADAEEDNDEDAEECARKADIQNLEINRRWRKMNYDTQVDREQDEIRSKVFGVIDDDVDLHEKRVSLNDFSDEEDDEESSGQCYRSNSNYNVKDATQFYSVASSDEDWEKESDPYSFEIRRIRPGQFKEYSNYKASHQAEFSKRLDDRVERLKSVKEEERRIRQERLRKQQEEPTRHIPPDESTSGQSLSILDQFRLKAKQDQNVDSEKCEEPKKNSSTIATVASKSGDRAELPASQCGKNSDSVDGHTVAEGKNPPKVKNPPKHSSSKSHSLSSQAKVEDICWVGVRSRDNPADAGNTTGLCSSNQVDSNEAFEESWKRREEKHKERRRRKKGKNASELKGNETHSNNNDCQQPYSEKTDCEFGSDQASLVNGFGEYSVKGEDNPDVFQQSFQFQASEASDFQDWRLNGDSQNTDKSKKDFSSSHKSKKVKPLDFRKNNGTSAGSQSVSEIAVASFVQDFNFASLLADEGSHRALHDRKEAFVNGEHFSTATTTSLKIPHNKDSSTVVGKSNARKPKPLDFRKSNASKAV